MPERDASQQVAGCLDERERLGGEARVLPQLFGCPAERPQDPATDRPPVGRVPQPRHHGVEDAADRARIPVREQLVDELLLEPHQRRRSGVHRFEHATGVVQPALLDQAPAQLGEVAFAQDEAMAALALGERRVVQLRLRLVVQPGVQGAAGDPQQGWVDRGGDRERAGQLGHLRTEGER
jgi:hypothetical protein